MLTRKCLSILVYDFRSKNLMKIPGVAGEALTKGHEKDIELHSISMGASNPSSVGSGSGSGAGKVDISSLGIQKQVDLASAKLFQQCCAGKHFEEATMPRGGR